MGLFDSLKKKKKMEKLHKELDKRIAIEKAKYEASPDEYMERFNQKYKSKPKTEPIYPSKPEFNPVVLYWVSCKKKGYEVASNKAPQWFLKDYGIDFNAVLQEYTDSGCVDVENGIAKVTEKGFEELKEQSHVVYIHNHKRYDLKVSDFTSAKNFKKAQNTDIAWGIFNSRYLKYINKGMWEKLALNYANMADLLVEEKKYQQALDFVFAVAYLETSGMKDGNKLAPISPKANSVFDNGIPAIFLMAINNYYVTTPFLKIQEALDLPWTEIRKKYISSRTISGLEENLPFRYFEKEESFIIFRQAVETGEKKGEYRIERLPGYLKTNMPDIYSKTPYYYDSVANKYDFLRDSYEGKE